ncbi:P-loop containing nucleoside triphosphate hydrolase protein [Gymnopilus junonius]|uniref:P-loop containing nucleoside triphosphate hydrolase protein n=1 Tax=Gymnopilus junonius TaxID=109634 RepID=A0A9P5N9V9_GYMJU|nr:P-loop containing nucleoside triphosphate hydrolase protein [Gymnopilus junonius]
MHTVLDSFGNAKTLMSSNASRHGRYLELHFSDRGRINAAKVLTFGLDKSRLTKLAHEERTYHIFYQFIAGATPAERDTFSLEDPSDYALLASSGCYRLPAGPFSDDSIAMGELRLAMRTLGFKMKHMTSIFSLIVAILLLGNLQFAEGDAHDVSASISNPHVLDQAARLLGVSSDDLSQILTNKTSYVRKELFTVLLNAEQSAKQRDQCVKDLYAILFAFIVETCNHRLAPSSADQPSPTQIVMLDQPGFQTRGPAGTTSMSLSGTQPLISAYGQNGFDEFCINFADEMLHSYVLRNAFEDGVGYNALMTSDGISLPSVSIMDNGACIELLRGSQLSEKSQRKPGGLLGIVNKACSSFKSGKGGDQRDDDLLQELNSKYSVHSSFVASPTSGSAADRRQFGINHYAGSASYDATNLVENDADLVDSAFVSLLRASSDTFVSKLLSGPSLAAERHNKDQSIIVQAQVSSRPLRQPSPILSSSTSPEDDLVARKSVDYIVSYELDEFCDRYVPTMRGETRERIIQCARANGWKEGADYVCGNNRIWLAYGAWKIVEDILRTQEERNRTSGDEPTEEDFGADDNTEYTHGEGGLAPPSMGYFGDSADNLLVTRTGPDGSKYQDQMLNMGLVGLQLLIHPMVSGDRSTTRRRANLARLNYLTVVVEEGGGWHSREQCSARGGGADKQGAPLVVAHGLVDNVLDSRLCLEKHWADEASRCTASMEGKGHNLLAHLPF